MVARQTLTLFVRVQILLPQPSKGYKKDIVHENPDEIGVFAVSAAEIPANGFVDAKQPFSLSEMTRTHTKPNKQLRAYGYKKVHALFYCSFSKNQKVTQ